MNKLRLLGLCAGTLSLGAGFALVACSDDSTVTPSDAGSDRGTTPPPPNPPNPPNPPPPPVDGGDAAPPYDGGSVTQYAADLAVAACHTLARCCYGNPDPDAGSLDGGRSFNKAKCLSVFTNAGFEGSAKYFATTDAGGLVLDAKKAGECVQLLDTRACNLPGTEEVKDRAACFGAVQGTGTNGTPCKNALECAPGFFCNVPDGGASDGGTGTCAPLRGVGGPCGDFTTDIAQAQEACSWRGAGGDQFCNVYSDFANAIVGPRQTWKCEASRAVGADCDTNGWCTASLCENNVTSKCTTPLPLFTPNDCAFWTTP